jgi:hypothetical protein
VRDDVHDAIDSACSGEDPRMEFTSAAKPPRRSSFDRVKRLLLNVVRDLPEDMSVRELREELED